MTAIIIITFVSLMLYRLGAARLILEAASLDGYRPPAPRKRHRKPAPVKVPEAAPAKAAGIVPETIQDRRKLEAIAANIMTARGARLDAWGIVRGMTNKELNDIINDGY